MSLERGIALQAAFCKRFGRICLEFLAYCAQHRKCKAIEQLLAGKLHVVGRFGIPSSCIAKQLGAVVEWRAASSYAG